jgi:hypothetical protein
MSERVRWVGRMIQRRRVDGRFPRHHVTLVRDLVVLRMRARMQGVCRRLRPTWETTRGTPPLRSADGEWRRWAVAGEIDVSLSELPHALCDVVLPLLTHLEPFLIDDVADGAVHLGLPLGARSAALTALGGLERSEGWYLESRRGGRAMVALVHSRRGRLRARRAEHWHVYRCLGQGSRVVGRRRGLLISFWTPGAGGRMERVGVRGLERFEPDAPRTIEHVAGREYPGLGSFPVGRALTRLREPVDVVYTWVDGADLAWVADLEHWRQAEPSHVLSEQSTHPARFASHDELRYSLRSLWLNAGWIRNVYVVTAGQVPRWLREDERLRIVPHCEIFPADWLPTFNSHAIESRLHHIDGLAEHFLYLNDDMFIGRPLGPDRFFTANGLSRFFESEARVPLRSSSGDDRAVDAAARRGQQLISESFGSIVVNKLHHAPYALRRSVLYELGDRFAEAVDATSRHRFRDSEDISIPSAFAHHYGFCTGRAVPGELEVVYENLGSRRLKLVLERLALGRTADAICINETEQWETPHDRAVARLEEFLEDQFPVPSPWEVITAATA